MRFRTFKRYFNEAFKGIARNRIMSFSSMATVAACIFIVIFSYCVAVNISYILEQLENSVGITAILDENLTQEQITTLRDRIKLMKNVREVEFVSSEQALANFSEMLGDGSQEILQGLEDDNPLRNSFTITLESSRFQDDVIKSLENMASDGVAKVRHARETTNLLISVNNVVRIISIAIIAILGVLSIVIIMNTIKLTVNNRKNEISIMKYVGATDWFIKWPFIIEGLAIGVIGALIPSLTFWLGYNQVIDAIENNFEFLHYLMQFKSAFEIFPVIMPVTISIGAFIGVAGSVTSMRKYLNV